MPLQNRVVNHDVDLINHDINLANHGINTANCRGNPRIASTGIAPGWQGIFD
jgi:hypothetical protein